jgi:hypothetical protein
VYITQLPHQIQNKNNTHCTRCPTEVPAALTTWLKLTTCRFYYADERKLDGSPKYRVDGDAHADLYSELSENKAQLPWMRTFVKDQGYLDFGDKYCWSMNHLMLRESVASHFPLTSIRLRNDLEFDIGCESSWRRSFCLEFGTAPVLSFCFLSA